MALLWIPQDQTGDYAAALLKEGTLYIVSALPDRRIEVKTGTPARLDSGDTVMIRGSNLTAGNGDLWCLYCSKAGAVRVSSVPVLTNLSVLRNRDLITMADGSHFYFSTERLARIVPFPGSKQPALCPRDRLPIEEATPAVQCPRCLTWYHQTDDCPCYTYADTCASCQGRTTLEATFEWIPERR